MEIFINLFYWLLLLTAILLIPFNIPGNVIIAVLHLIYMWIFEDVINWKLFTILVVLAAVAEIIEYLVTIHSTRRFGGSRRSMIGSIVGSIAGAMIGSAFLILIGTLIGAMIGAFIGSFIMNYQENNDIDIAMRSGMGAFWGVAGGKFTKIMLGVIMLIAIAVM
jgi:uncharacterized protein YqgC (DUF456 family)